MSKPFTSSAAILLLVLLQACATGGGTKSTPVTAADSAAPNAANGETTQRGVGVDADLPPLGEDLPALPTPPVHGRNAVAFDQAVTAMREGRMGDAEIVLLEITVDQPELAGPWINLGRLYVALQQPEEARRAFESAIRANPRNCTAYNELGVLSRQVGDFAAAEEHYRTCLAQTPSFRDAYLNLGILYELYLGKLPEALQAYKRYQSLRSEPDRRVQGWVMDLQRRLGV